MFKSLKSIDQFPYKFLSGLVCFTLPVVMIVVGYVVAPVLFAELGQKQAGAIGAILFSHISLLVLIGLFTVIVLYAVFEKSMKSIKSVVVSLLLMGVLKFWISPWMAEIKASYPAGLSYAAVDWRLFASLHGVYQLLYLVVVLLLLYWSFRIFAIVIKVRNNH